jgi:hypothetical protein
VPDLRGIVDSSPKTIGSGSKETDMDHTFTRRFTTALAGPTLAVGVLAGTLIVDTPAASDTMGLSLASASSAGLVDIHL